MGLPCDNSSNSDTNSVASIDRLYSPYPPRLSHSSFLIRRWSSVRTGHFSPSPLRLLFDSVACLLSLTQPSLKPKAWWRVQVLAAHASASRRVCASADALVTVTSVVSMEEIAVHHMAVVSAPASRKVRARVEDRATVTSARRGNTWRQLRVTDVHFSCHDEESGMAATTSHG